MIAIISILAAILFPVFQSIRENARRASCASNEKQLGLAVLQYVQDNDELLVAVSGSPTQPHWTMRVYPYVNSYDVYKCPDDLGRNDMNAVGAGDRESYGINTKLSSNPSGNNYIGISMSAINWPADLCLFMEDSLSVAPGQSAGYKGVMDRGGTEIGYANVWYACAAAAGCFAPVVDDEANAPYTNADYATPYARHSGGANVAFTDGHVKWLRYAALYNPPAGTTPANFRLWHPDAQ